MTGRSVYFDHQSLHFPIFSLSPLSAGKINTYRVFNSGLDTSDQTSKPPRNHSAADLTEACRKCIDMKQTDDANAQEKLVSNIDEILEKVAEQSRYSIDLDIEQELQAAMCPLVQTATNAVTCCRSVCGDDQLKNVCI